MHFDLEVFIHAVELLRLLPRLLFLISVHLDLLVEHLDQLEHLVFGVRLLLLEKDARACLFVRLDDLDDLLFLEQLPLVAQSHRLLVGVLAD